MTWTQKFRSRWALAAATVVALIVAAVVVAVATSDEPEPETVEFSGMDMTRADIDEMIEESMGTKRMADVPRKGPDDRADQLEPTMDGTTKVFELTPEPVRWEYRDKQPIAAWGYEGQVPGPAITVNEGDLVRVKVNNKLPEATTVHWHGVDLPFEQDGVPGLTQKAIEPGESYTYEFRAKPAGTRFYHTHGPSMEDEARQLDMGLSGALIIKPKGERPPTRDYTMILDEWLVEQDGLNAAMMSGAGHAAHNAGYNLFTINGRAAPAVESFPVKTGDTVRLRLINAGTSTTHPIHLHGHQFTVTAIDGNPVPAAALQQRNVITVSPGETYDITFTANNPGVWMLHCHELHHADAGMMTLVKYDGVEPVEDIEASEEDGGH